MTFRQFSFASRIPIRSSLLFLAAAIILFPFSSGAHAQQQVTEPPYISGQTLTHNGFVQAALDGETGKTVFIYTPNKAPAPTHTNPAAQAPIYIVAYPVTSTIPADDLDCTVTNCKGLNVLPFPNENYGPASDTACDTFAPKSSSCSEVEGHDHIVGTPFTGGDFNVAWHKVLVVFTAQGFDDGAIDNRITTVDQLDGLIASKDVVTMDLPASSFVCALVPKSFYERGTPVTVIYP